ncbi:MAG: sulfotransferase, partial [Acidobacteriota bacterium]
MTHGSSLAPPPRWPIQAYNALARAGVRLGCRPAPIRVRDVLRTARRSTGLADLGEQRIAEPLARLTRGYDMEAGLSPFGRRVARGILESLLAERLRIVDVLTRHPEIREIPIRQPMFVVGFPRTGTTLLYNLLAQSAGARALLTWESVYPAPPPGGRATRRDPRARRVSWQIRLIKYLVPEFDTIHELDAMAPEEDMRLLRHTFVSWAFALPGDMPGYIEWLMQVEPETVREAYRFYRNQLQLLSWRHEPARW